MKEISLLHKVREVFNQAQDGDIVLSKLCEKLSSLQLESSEEDFLEAFIHHIEKSIIYYKSEPSVERVVDLIANFATYATRLRNKQKQDQETRAKSNKRKREESDKEEKSLDLSTFVNSEDDEDEDEEELIEPFLMQCLTFFVKHHDARERGARLRCCQLINKVLNLLGDQATIDEDLSDAIYECMMIRIKDVYPPIRIQAVLALFRLQDPSDEECPVIDAYLTSLGRDINALVRKTILLNIAISRKTLPFLIERVRDVNDVNRKTAYNVLSEKVSIRALSIAQRIHLITNGLKNDIVENVKKACGNMLKSWHRSCDHSYVKLLEALDTESDPECSQLVLDYLLSGGGYEKWLEASKQVVEMSTRLIQHNHLTPEKVFLWFSVCKYAKNSENNDFLNDLLPDLTPFCEYIRLYAEKNFIDSALLTAFEGVAQTEFILEHLIQILDFFDLSDEVGRKNLHQLIHDLLTLEVIPSTLIEVLIKQFRKIHTDEDKFIEAVVEIIADIKQPLVKVVSTAMKEKARMLQLQLARVTVNIHECNDDLECAVKQQDYQQASLLKDHIAELETQKSDLEVMIDECQETSTKRVEREEDPETTLKCLTIGTAMLCEISKRGLSSTLMTLKDDVFFEGVKNEDPYIRNEAVKALGLLSLMKKEFAAQHLVFFLQVVQVDQEFVKVTAIKVIFDLFLMYGLTTFDEKPDADETARSEVSADGDGSQNIGTDNSETDKADKEDDLNNEEEGDTSAAESVLGVLIMFLQDESSDLRSIVAEGMAKVMITGRVVSPNVLSRLIILWYNPISEDDAQLRHCLGSFLPAFAFRSRKNQEVVEEAFLLTLRTLFNAPTTSPLSHIVTSNVIDLFVQLTDIKNMVAFSANQTSNNLHDTTAKLDQYEDFVHDSMASKICNEILSNTNDATYVKLLAKSLNQLTICPRNFDVINDLIELCTQIIGVVIENKAAKRLIEKFMSHLQGVSFIETTRGDSQSSGIVSNAEDTNETDLTGVGAEREDTATPDEDTTTTHDENAEPLVEENTKVLSDVGENLMKPEFVPPSALKNPLSLSTRSNRSSRNVSFRSPPPKMPRLSTSIDFKINK